jgi:DNA-binding Lrp family transcriptional regulator
MRTDTSKKIIEYLGKNGHITAKELVDYLGISYQAVFKQLRKLTETGKIYKIGKAPRVFYFLSKKEKTVKHFDFDNTTEKIINENFLIITPAGERMEGVEGFAFWCQKNNQPTEKTAREYVKTLRKYDFYRKNGLIDGMNKMKKTFPHVYLDHLFYLDFYSIERFGKTKLGQMLLYAKQSQNKTLIKELIGDIEPRIKELAKEYNVDAVGFIPPTIKREVQFMKELERHTHLNLHEINLVKVKTEVTIPQKTLNKLEDRIENAEATIIVDEKKSYKNILLVDDAVGSGATLNETARKLKDNEICFGEVIGLAITGSFKGFDVISEV